MVLGLFVLEMNVVTGQAQKGTWGHGLPQKLDDGPCLLGQQFALNQVLQKIRLNHFLL